jgi:hypothetical protein
MPEQSSIPDSAHALTALDLERAVDAQQTAKMLDVAVITLSQWRARGEGPRYFKVGRRGIRYRLGDVLAWRDARMVGRV